MNISRVGFAMAVVLPLWLGRLAAQETVENPEFENRGVQLQFGGLVQTQFNTTTSGRAEEVTELLLRRVRFSVNARVNELISGRIQAEFATEAAELNEAYLLLAPDPGVQFLAGKGGRPFGIIDANTAATLIPIERGASIRGEQTLELYRILEVIAYAGRSVGVQVFGEPTGAPLGLVYAVGYFSGAVAEEGEDADIQQVAARLQIEPLPSLLIGSALSSRKFGSCMDCVDRVEERGSAWEVDAQYGEYGTPGWILLAQYSAGALNPFTGADFRGAQAWAAYRTPPLARYVAGVEPLLRWSYGDPEGELSPFGGTLWTPGVNLYLGRNNRLMLNYDIWTPEEGEAESAFRAQMQLAF